MNSSVFDAVPEPDMSAVLAVRNSLQNKASVFYGALQQLQESGVEIPNELKLAEDVIFCCLTEYDPAMVSYIRELQQESGQLRYKLECAHTAFQNYVQQLGIKLPDEGTNP